MDLIQDQAGKQFTDVLSDKGGEINVLPRFVRALAAWQGDQTRYRPGHLHDGVQRFATSLQFCPHQQVMASVQKMRKRMAGIHGQGSEHWKNFLLKITMCPRRAFCRQFRHFAHVDFVLRKFGQQFIFPQRVLRRDELAHGFLDTIKCVRRT